MPNYQICYIDRGGSLVGTISTECASPKQAAILAHALKFRDPVQVEVWDGDRLTYVRPAVFTAMAVPTHPYNAFPKFFEQPSFSSAR